MDGDREIITKNGRTLKLGGKASEVFRLLMETPEKVVSREAICERLWPDSAVDVDANLAATMNKLRRIL